MAVSKNSALLLLLFLSPVTSSGTKVLKEKRLSLQKLLSSSPALKQVPRDVNNLCRRGSKGQDVDSNSQVSSLLIKSCSNVLVYTLHLLSLKMQTPGISHT